MRIRIVAKPVEEEIDGLKLSGFRPGMVRNVSSVLGLWMIAQGYAQPEMREEVSREQSANERRATSDDRLHRRYSDKPKIRR
jgi:hypothetical protein